MIWDRADASFDGYEVVAILGRGGMGVVYEAVQSSLQRKVALKVLRTELAEDPAFVERFRREGQLQASIEHPNVLDVYEVGESPDAGLFLAMRLIDGPTLADLLREGGLGAGQALNLLDQIAAALDAAHAAGLVHRDVKPQNILVGEGDHAFLADFGLSKAGDDPVTSTRPTVGTVAYVAPEVIRGETPQPASDRYAFAATLFHCLTGSVVFPRGSDAAALFAHASEPPPAISERRPELPESLDALFRDALAKDPAERPASACELVASVRAALGEELEGRLGPPQGGVLRAESAETVPSSTPSTPLPAAPRAAPASRRRLLPVAAIALVAAAIGAGAGLLIAGDEEAAPEVPVPSPAPGAEVLGSTLEVPDMSVGCRGSAPSAESPSCSIVQTDLPDSQLLVPADGAIVGWTVRGAEGDVALDVIRPGGSDTVRVGRSQWESAGNVAPHHFGTSLAVEGGDRLGIELGPGATIGVEETEGATTQRWFEPKGGAYGAPDRGPGTGLDYELSLRAEFVPGGEVEAPEELTGAAAARAPKGLVRESDRVEISKPPATVTVELVEVGGRVALDLFSEGRRVERTFLPDLMPGGQPVAMETYTYEGQEVSEVGVWWVNPNTGRLIFRFLNVSQRQIDYLG